MPVRKPAAAKKKTPAKSAAPALSKKVAAKKTAAKKTPAKKSSASGSKGDNAKIDSLAQNICKAIVSGDFDGNIKALDDALTERINARAKESAKKTPAAKEEKKVGTAPKRKPAEKKEPLVPVKDKTYKIERLKKFLGAKVKFLRHKDGDESKAVVEMMSTDVAGYPKGKRFVVPTSALAKTR